MRDLFAIENYIAFVRGDQTREDVKKCAFATTARSDNGYEFPLASIKTNALENLQFIFTVGKGSRKVINLEKGITCSLVHIKNRLPC